MKQLQTSAGVYFTDSCFHPQKSLKRVRGLTATRRSSGVFLESTGRLWLLSSATCTGEPTQVWDSISVIMIEQHLIELIDSQYK